jgi:hypothetical protein
LSLHRLREEFYGLPARAELMRERLVKEGVQELGHTFGLRHCDDWRCVMASSHAVERLDVKGRSFAPRADGCWRTMARARAPVFILGREAQDLDFRPAGDRGLGALHDTASRLLGEVVFAAIAAYVGRNTLKDHCRVATLEGNSHNPRGGFAVFANDTVHFALFVR